MAALAVVAAGLLVATLVAALVINGQAARIATAGDRIAGSTQTIRQLRRTNALARDILGSARPLPGQLASIINDANGINGTTQSINGVAAAIQGSAARIDTEARSINGTAGTINGEAQSINASASQINGLIVAINATAGRIDGLARTINGTAGVIDSRVTGVDVPVSGVLAVARRIRFDVAQINRIVDVTIALSRSIEADTGDILGEAFSIRGAAACTDKKLNGGPDPDCPNG